MAKKKKKTGKRGRKKHKREWMRGKNGKEWFHNEPLLYRIQRLYKWGKRPKNILYGIWHFSCHMCQFSQKLALTFMMVSANCQKHSEPWAGGGWGGGKREGGRERRADKTRRRGLMFVFELTRCSKSSFLQIPESSVDPGHQIRLFFCTSRCWWNHGSRGGAGVGLRLRLGGGYNSCISPKMFTCSLLPALKQRLCWP